MPRKVIIIAGAPEAHLLDWAPSTLLNHFLEPFVKFAGLETSHETAGNKTFPSTLDGVAVWRSIPLRRERIPTGFSQVQALARPYQGTADFFNTLSASASFDAGPNPTADESTQDIIDQFYDHSLAIHEDMSSSQLQPTGSSIDESSFDITGEVSSDFTESFGDLSHEADRPPQLVDFGHLSDLEDLPNARYLESIQPQTMTVNIIVGVISVTQPRVVKTRWGYSKTLVELVVADETRSGLTVTFWLSPEQTPANALLQTLRRQDILLLRNVALGVFMNKVHGHSLRKGHTKIHLLHRRRMDKNDQGGLYTMKQVTSAKAADPQLSKTRRVWEWLLHFVGDGGTTLPGSRRDLKRKALRRWDMPPADTQ
ncbi:hypothetical protein F5Y17DRAFT_438562 [Xylariaceae sp. FL0594]|nr:hypothetical protein F5Y17DRAFT_438562 [Xylariaceae sp. FL0594]